MEVFGSDKDVTIVMLPEQAFYLADFANFASWWAMEYCQWNNYCNKSDLNFDNVVDLADLVIFTDRWLDN